MFLGQLLFALFLALLFTLVFAVGLQRTGPWATFWTFFLIIFLAVWASELWVTPVGPVLVGIYWLPLILIAFIFAVLLSVSVPPHRKRPKIETISQVKQDEADAKQTFDFLFWLLLAGLAAMIFLGYFLKRPFS